MSGKMGSNHRVRKLKMESLEKRELMAANVTAEVSGGSLIIQGTSAADYVVVDVLSTNTRVWANGKRILQVPTSSYSSLDAKMGDGNDNLRVLLASRTGMNRIDVNMGRGSSENLSVEVGRANVVNVNADQSVATDIFLRKSSIDTVMANFGNDGGNDWLSINECSINYLETGMGGGNDAFGVSRTSINRAKVNLGSGNDLFQIWTTDSQIANGFVDGGTGRDRFRNMGKNSPGRVAVSNFEW